MRRLVFIVALTFVLIGELDAAEAHAQADEELSPRSAAGEAALERWRAEFARARADDAAAPQDTVAEELAHRVALEQAGREALTPIMQSELPATEKRAVLSTIWGELSPLDADNTRWLKTVLPADGWFRISRDGRDATRNAWLIVQHSSDLAFQKQVLKAMGPLVAKSEVNRPDFALLYDRLEMFEGRPQRYGSQARCENGALAIYTLEDAERVDELRRQVGLTTSLEEYKQRMGVGRAC